MKPRARLRTSPRSASVSAANGALSMNTSPADGASKPPSRCSKVLLPDPEAPTTATRSPAPTSKSTPISTGTSSGPLRYVLRRPRHPSTDTCARAASSFIPECLGRIHARRAPARIDRGGEREEQRDQRDGDHIAALQVGRQIADVVNGLIEKLNVERALDGGNDRIDIERGQHAGDDADQRADDADQHSLNHEDRQDRFRRRAERAQDRDVGLL